MGEGKKGVCLFLLARHQGGEDGARCDSNGKVRAIVRRYNAMATAAMNYELRSTSTRLADMRTTATSETTDDQR